ATYVWCDCSSADSLPHAIPTLSLHVALPIFAGPNCSTYLLDVIGCFNLNRPINQPTTSNTQMNGAMRNNDLLVGILAHIYSMIRSEEHTSELQSRFDLVCRLLLEQQKESTSG